MTWLILTENVCHQLPLICSVCRSQNSVHLSSFITYHWIVNRNNTMGATRGEETGYP